MAAEDNLSGELFHGTIHPFKKGDIIKPQTHEEAFATPDSEYASKYAAAGSDRATREAKDERLNVKDEPALFGTVYKVEPVDQEDVRHTFSDDRDEAPVVASKSGFRVTGVHSYTPTNAAIAAPHHCSITNLCFNVYAGKGGCPNGKYCAHCVTCGKDFS